MTSSSKLSCISVLLGVLSACAGTIPVAYEPQNFVRYEGRADVGKFTYTPAQLGKLDPNQIENTAVGTTIYIGADVAEFVRRATALELEKTGVALTDRSPVQVSGEVLRFKAGDFGFNIDWTYCVRYKVTRKSDSREVLDAVYKVEKKSGKSNLASDLTPSVNELILSGYDQFIRDDRTRAVLAASPEALGAITPAVASTPARECDARRRLMPAKLTTCDSDMQCKDGGICYQGACR